MEIFRAAHPGTVEVYDITHKAACLLKARLEGDERWKSYSTELGQAKFRMQQTELAGLVPPSQRSKARFMNVGKLVDWGAETLALLDDPARLEPLGITRGAAAGEAELAGGLSRGAWGVVGVSGGDRRDVGLRAAAGAATPGLEIDLAAAVPERSGPAEELRGELIDFVRGASR